MVDEDELREVGRRFAEAQAVVAAVRAELVAAIKAAEAGGMSKQRIIDLTGVARATVFKALGS